MKSFRDAGAGGDGGIFRKRECVFDVTRYNGRGCGVSCRKGAKSRILGIGRVNGCCGRLRREKTFNGSEADELGMGSLVQVQVGAVLDRCRCSWWCSGDGWNGAAAEFSGFLVSGVLLENVGLRSLPLVLLYLPLHVGEEGCFLRSCCFTPLHVR